MHCTGQGIFFTEFQNSVISEFNHKSTVLHFSKYFIYSQFLHTENYQNCWQVATSAESQELHRWAFTPNKGSSQSGSWMGQEDPAQGGCKEDLWSPSVTCHAQCSTCCLNPYHHLYSREANSTTEKKEEAVSPGLPMPMAYQDMDLRTDKNVLTHCFFPLLPSVLAGR